jgi:NadR type nicotinamide-nucleotide adenylyltransferase
MLKVVITGPESTGKSTLAKQLADCFNVDMVKEYARTYLEKLDRPYEQSDLTAIAKGQIMLEDNALANNSRMIICDTSLEVIKIWSDFKYHSCDPFISDSYYKRKPHFYLLMTPDLPWQPDPLRENPFDRDELFEIYQKELISTGTPFYEILGNGEERLKMAKGVIKNHLK